MEYIAWLIGLITGIGVFCINDSRPDFYRKGYEDGYEDGYNDAFEFIKQELERRKVK